MARMIARVSPREVTGNLFEDGLGFLSTYIGPRHATLVPRTHSGSRTVGRGIACASGAMARPTTQSGPTRRGGQAPLALSQINRFSMAALHGRAGRLTVLRGGLRLVQWEPEVNLAGAVDVYVYVLARFRRAEVAWPPGEGEEQEQEEEEERRSRLLRRFLSWQRRRHRRSVAELHAAPHRLGLHRGGGQRGAPALRPPCPRRRAAICGVEVTGGGGGGPAPPPSAPARRRGRRGGGVHSAHPHTTCRRSSSPWRCSF
jgi:hypothetical protein